MRQKVKRGLIYTAGLSVALLLMDIPHLHQPKIDLTKPTQMSRTKATWEEKGENKRIAKTYAASGWGWKGREWLCLHDLWTRESRFDHYAQNPTSSAFGIAQLLRERDRRPRIQILRGLRYIESRYGSPCRAKTFQDKHGYY
jgi:hypothetical protein